MAIASISKRIYESLVNFRIHLSLDKQGRARRKAIFSALEKHDNWLTRVPAYGLPRYRKVVSGLPRPSTRQIHDFVQFVSEAHSWYKHLPEWQAPGLFQFYLDPCVGYDIQHLADGSVRILERTGNIGFHYTWMPTKKYRERFGYLAYHCDSGTSVMVQTDSTLQANDERQALAFTRDGQPFFVPAALGRVALTGVVHRYAADPSAWRLFAKPEHIKQVHRAWKAGRNVRLDTILKPERERQRRKMQKTINQMLETLGPQR